MRKTCGALVLGLGLAVALAGCGSSGRSSSGAARSGGPSGGAGGNGEASKPAKQIVADAAAALRSAKGYVMHAVTIKNGRRERMSIARPGDGSADVSLATGNTTAEMIISASGYFIRANAPFWASHVGARANQFANHWIQVPPVSGQSLTASLGRLAPSTLARCLVESHGALSVAGRTSVAGKPAVVVSDAGDVPGSAPGTLAVAATGTPYPLELTTTGPRRPGGRIDVCNDGKVDNSHGTLTISDFGSVPAIQPPKSPLRLGHAVSA